MRTATGLQAFYRSLALPYDQLLVAEGDLTQMRRTCLLVDPAAGTLAVASEADAADIAPDSLLEKTQDYLRKQFSSLLKLPFHRIDPQAALENYGMDSILAMKLTNQLEKTFGSLSKTLFFEYQTIAGLTGYFVTQYAKQLTVLFAATANRTSEAMPLAEPPSTRSTSNRRFKRELSRCPQPGNGTRGDRHYWLERPVSGSGQYRRLLAQSA